ncbi:hypothetical protein CR513_07132, partial [Mucuna pruriens]
MGERHERDVRLERNRREERRERHGRRGELREEELHMFKSKIPLFLGDCKPDEYINWELMVDKILSPFDLHGRKLVRLVTLEFYRYAMVWWNQVLEEIRSDKRGPCEGWRDLKCLMRERFVPSSYIWDLHVKLQRLHQGPYSVEEYHKEVEMDLLRVQIKESEEATMTRFLHGLTREIQDIEPKLNELVHQAIKVEMQLRRRSAFRKTSIKCFKCIRKGRIASQCPNRRVMIVKDDGEIESESSEGEGTTSNEFESFSDGSHYEGTCLWLGGL